MTKKVNHEKRMKFHRRVGYFFLAFSLVLTLLALFYVLLVPDYNIDMPQDLLAILALVISFTGLSWNLENFHMFKIHQEETE